MTGILADAAGTAVAGGFGLIFLVLVGLTILTSVFWLWMLVDAITSSLPPTEKLIWVIVILFLHVVGALIYFFVGRGSSGVTMTGVSGR